MQKFEAVSIAADRRGSDSDSSFHSVGVNVNAYNMKISPRGYCTTCSNPSVATCKRCGDFYCSPKCQKDDWSNHRYICFPMPPLVYSAEACVFYNNAPLPIEDNGNNKESDSAVSEGSNEIESAYSKSSGRTAASSKISTQTSPPSVPFPKYGSCVIFVAFKTINRCYIRSSDPSDIKGYENLMKKLNQYGKNAPKLINPPQLNAYYITLHHGKCCRVQIMSDDGDNLQVLFIDYGFIKARTVEDLYEISEEILGLPCFIKLIQLKGVYISKSRKKGEDKLKRFLEYENREFKVLWVKRDLEIPIAKLLHWETNISLASDINYFLKINKPRKGDSK